MIERKKGGQKPFATPEYSEDEEARFRVMQILDKHNKINREVLDRRVRGQSWMVILGWLLSQVC